MFAVIPLKNLCFTNSVCAYKGVFFTEFQHVNCVRIWEVKRVACYTRAETFTEAVASVASMVATTLPSPSLALCLLLALALPALPLALLAQWLIQKFWSGGD